MKKLIMLALSCLFFSTYGLANGGPVMSGSKTPTMKRSEIKTSTEQTEKTRERMEENPRNRGMAGSFGQVNSEEEEAKAEEENNKKKIKNKK